MNYLMRFDAVYRLQINTTRRNDMENSKYYCKIVAVYDGFQRQHEQSHTTKTANITKDDITSQHSDILVMCCKGEGKRGFVQRLVVNIALRRSGMVCVLKGSHSFICTPHIHPLTE